MDILEGLNKKQQEAILTTEGPVRIIAGAGSGKTLTLTKRYCYLVEELGIPTQNILCVTFTNKAANEMKTRIRKMIGDKDTSYICTYHGFCVKVLREDIHVINYPKNFMILDEDDSESILRTVYQELGINSSIMTFKEARNMISKMKNDISYIKYFWDLDNISLEIDIKKTETIEEKIFLKYIYEEKKNYALDFDDLIMITLSILQKNEEVRCKWQKRLYYIMVDEFQDVSLRQYTLIEILSAYHNNLFIVGDPDQNIYLWRGALMEFILHFDKEHLNTKTIILDENYRSTNNILKATNSLISKNKERIKKDMFTRSEKNIPVVHNHFTNNVKESEYIVSEIKRIKKETNCSLNDFAIIYRAHYVSRCIEDALIRENISYEVYSGIPFYQRTEIKDIISYLRMLIFQDDISFLRTINNPRRGFGEKRIKFLKDFSEQYHCNLYQALLYNLDEPLIKSTSVQEYVDLIEKYSTSYKAYFVSDLLDKIIKESGYEEYLRTLGEDERLENVSELKESIFDLENSKGDNIDLETYLQDIALFTNTEKKGQKDSVKLLTVHTAKGLEWENVFVCQLNEGVFPSSRIKTPIQLEEERRVCYVAMTRAKSRLILTSADGYTFYSEEKMISRFITDIDKRLIKFLAPIKLIQNIHNEEKYLINEPSFLVGDTVIHQKWGRGVIEKIDEYCKCYIIYFEEINKTRPVVFSVKLIKINKN